MFTTLKLLDQNFFCINQTAILIVNLNDTGAFGIEIFQFDDCFLAEYLSLINGLIDVVDNSYGVIGIQIERLIQLND